MHTTVAMMMREVYPLVWSFWLTAVMGKEWLIDAINDWLNYIYSYKWQKKNWMIRTAAVWAGDQNWEFEAATKYPIVDVLRFYCSDKLECITTHQKQHTECCKGQNPRCMWECDCSCNPCKVNREIKDMVLVWPWSTISPWQYKISWWEIGFGWMFGNYVQGVLPHNMCCSCGDCPQLYMTYHAWFNRVTCASDIIPLPAPYMTALKFLIVGFTIARFLTHRAGDDLMYIQMADRFLDGYNQLQVNVPTFIRNTNS